MIRQIYEDDHILVVDKPAGLVADPNNTSKEETLADILQKDFGIKLFRGGIVHRLDKDTSGIILVAKTQAALDNLQSQFKTRVVKKEYLTLVHGFVETKGIVDASIIRNPENREKFTVISPGRSLPRLHLTTFGVNCSGQESPPPRWPNGLLGGGREAVTEYEPLQNFKFSILNFQSIFNDYNKIQMRKLERQNYGEFTLLRCYPLTGRTHQIRVHLKYINHPIVSDEKYVGRKINRLDRRWCPRQFLHAVKIGFKHPVSGEWMELESELPEDLEKAMDNLKC